MCYRAKAFLLSQKNGGQVIGALIRDCRRFREGGPESLVGLPGMAGVKISEQGPKAYLHCTCWRAEGYRNRGWGAQTQAGTAPGGFKRGIRHMEWPLIL